MRSARRRLLVFLGVPLVFAASFAASTIFVLFVVGLLDRCIPLADRCRESVFWAMVATAPIWAPICLVVAVASSVAVRLKIARALGEVDP